MDILPLLDELQTIARNGLFYARDPYDRERYERLMELASMYYGQSLDLPPAEARARLAGELGYITPKVGSDVALFDDEGRILLEQRRDDGRWCLPCGWVEPNESPDAAIVREAREEVGLDVVVTELVTVFPIMPSADTGPHTAVAIVYLGEVVGGELAISHESLDAGYRRIEDVRDWHGHHRDYAEAAADAWRRRRDGQ